MEAERWTKRSGDVGSPDLFFLPLSGRGTVALPGGSWCLGGMSAIPLGVAPVSEGTTAGTWVDEPAARNWSPEEEQALRLWISLARCYVTFSRAVACKVAEYDLTAPQFGVLEALFHLGPLSLGELAEKLLVTGGNVTYVMDRLEAQGLVARERSGDDRRVVRAHLTKKGRSTIESVFPGHVDFVRSLVQGLGSGEREELRALLKKLGKGIADGGPPNGAC